MNQKEFIRTIANITGIPRETVFDVLATAGDVVTEVLFEGNEPVCVPHLGKFKSLRRAQRRMVLPDGRERTVGGKRVGKFVPGQVFRRRVNGEI